MNTNLGVLWLFVKSMFVSLREAYVEDFKNWERITLALSIMSASIVYFCTRTFIGDCSCGGGTAHDLFFGFITLAVSGLVSYVFFLFLPEVLNTLLNFYYYVANAIRDFYRLVVKKWADAKSKYMEKHGKD